MLNRDELYILMKDVQKLGNGMDFKQAFEVGMQGKFAILSDRDKTALYVVNIYCLRINRKSFKAEK